MREFNITDKVVSITFLHSLMASSQFTTVTKNGGEMEVYIDATQAENATMLVNPRAASTRYWGDQHECLAITFASAFDFATFSAAIGATATSPSLRDFALTFLDSIALESVDGRRLKVVFEGWTLPAEETDKIDEMLEDGWQHVLDDLDDNLPFNR